MRMTTWATRGVCLLYLLVLTTLLLAPDPLAWLRGVVPDISPPNRGVHFCAFFILTVLCGASRLPWRVSTLAGVLVVYAITTESLQSLVESRAIEMIDYAENLLGLAFGMLACWLVCGLVRPSRDDEQAAVDELPV